MIVKQLGVVPNHNKKRQFQSKCIKVFDSKHTSSFVYIIYILHRQIKRKALYVRKKS